MLKDKTLPSDKDEKNSTGNNQGFHLCFNNNYNECYRREAAQFVWLILSQYLLIFSLFLLFTTNMLFTSVSLLIMFGYFFSAIMNQGTASNKVFSALLTGLVLALAQDITITLAITSKVIFLLSLAFYFHAKLVKIIFR